MKVKELMAELAKYDPEAVVLLERTYTVVPIKFRGEKRARKVKRPLFGLPLYELSDKKNASKCVVFV